MAKRRVLTPVLLLLAASGCGTIRNLCADPEVFPRSDNPQSAYGGVRLDANTAAASTTLGWTDSPLLAFFWTLDLPLSAIGDTLTLPYILYIKNHRDNVPAVNQGTSGETRPSSAVQRGAS